ncbi:conserved hypothetical protein [Clostridium neonatale]|uniref:hypothetical protein n=1 Tax=Clostridium neonatale TaxID=137838 RepID=UPI00291B7264|nr:hypothetical protein [Clostridium neonatale]CAI3244150.1 conserved hypothetical protein [Clostridium neonatale]CAI3539651.1 conserved hypothetical protein [Clostridium neonatale]
MKTYKDVIHKGLYNHYNAEIKKYIDKQFRYLGEIKKRGFSYFDNLHIYKDINQEANSDNLICYLLFTGNNKVELKKYRGNKQIKYAGHFSKMRITPRVYDLSLYNDLMAFEALIEEIANI